MRFCVLAIFALSISWSAASPAGAQDRPLARTWARTCDEVSPPVPSVDGTTVFGCAARFDAALGRYQGRAPLGLLATVDAQRGIAESWGEPGILLVRLHGGPEPRPLARARGGAPEAVAVSSDARRVATIEGAGPGQIAVVVRALPSLRVLSRAVVPGVPPQVVDDADVAFDSQGAVLAALPCAGDRCALPGVVRLDGTRLVPVAGLEGPFAAAAFARDGAHVALIRAGGWLQVRATADGTITGRVELGATLPDRVVLSPDASRVAVASTDEVRVFAVGPAAGTTRLLLRTHPGGDEAAFSPVGDRLFIGGSAIAAIAPGPARAQTVRPEDLGIVPPPGWTAGVVHDRILTFPTMRGSEFAADEGLAGAWTNGRAQARVVVGDADEFVTFTDPNRWGLAVAERYEPYSPLTSPAERRAHAFRVSRDAHGQRSMEIHMRGDGCDPSDRWERIEEHGEALVHTTLEVPSFLVRGAEIGQWLHAFRFVGRAGLDGPGPGALPQAL